MTEELIAWANQKVADVQLWESTFSGKRSIEGLLAHTEIPVFATFLYVAFVFYGQKFFESRNPLNLKPLVALWNLGLAVFSILGATRVVPYLTERFLTNGYRWTVCTSPANANYFHDTPAGAWIYIFCMSKLPELVDTVFLVLQKKPVILLHWFHHFTVMLFCWHSWVVAAPTGIWFAGMNLLVHSIMYSYYFFMCFSWGRAIVRPFAILITSLQIIQMVFGITISISAFIFAFDGNGCAGADPSNVKMGLAMYIAYFILFAQLFKKLYLTPKPRDGSKHGKSSPVLVTPQPSPASSPTTAAGKPQSPRKKNN